MKIKLSDVLAFNQFFTKFQNEDFPIQTAFKLDKLSQSLSQSYEFYRTKMQSIIEKYSQKDEDGRPKMDEKNENILLQADYINECQEKVNELLNCDVEINDAPVFDLKELDKLNCTVMELRAISPFLAKEEN